MNPPTLRGLGYALNSLQPDMMLIKWTRKLAWCTEELRSGLAITYRITSA